MGDDFITAFTTAMRCNAIAVLPNDKIVLSLGKWGSDQIIPGQTRLDFYIPIYLYLLIHV